MSRLSWKVGELARKTGLTIRTLHHYDAIGLLVPTDRTVSGHRLYGEQDVMRLQQILSLRELGLGLDEVRQCLADPTFSPRRVIRLHLDRIKQEMSRLTRLSDRLAYLSDRLEQVEAASVDEFLQVIEEMTMFEKHYTPEQLDQLKARADQVGPERIAEVQLEWPRLMAEVQSAMDRGLEPTSPEVRALAERWKGLVQEFTGGDPAIASSLKNLWQSEETVSDYDTSGVRVQMEYISKAFGQP